MRRRVPASARVLEKAGFQLVGILRRWVMHPTTARLAGNRESIGAAHWIRATFAGWALGFGLLLVLITLTGLVGLGETQFAVGLGMGAGVGWTQGRLMNDLVGRRGWLAASAAGMALPFIVTDVAGLISVQFAYSLPVLVAAGGLQTGLLQWRLLRAVAMRAAAWVPAACLGWSLAASTVFINDRLLPRIPGIAGALLYIGVIMVGGLLLGAVEAVVLVRIARPARAAA